jgi:CheY-like chemotaxis protein
MSNASAARQLNGAKRPEEARVRLVATGPILVVEDNESILELIQIVLKSVGHEVLGVSDAETALEAATSSQPRLILMDVQLPGMSGLELAQRLKADPATADIIIVMVSAFAMESDIDKAREAGCDGYISKPLDVNALPGTLAGYLAGDFTR